MKITDEGRFCGKCEQFLSWDNFSRNKTHTTGYQSRCKPCTSTSATKYVPRGKRKESSEPEKGFSELAQNFIFGRV